mgnify:CR=1 FL=1
MSSQPNTLFHSDLDSSPLLLPAKVLRNDAEALQAARELADVAREQAARRQLLRHLRAATGQRRQRRFTDGGEGGAGEGPGS